MNAAHSISRLPVSKSLLLLNVSLAGFYLFVLFSYFKPANPLLFRLLLITQAFHVWQLLTFIWTIWRKDKPFSFDRNFKPSVDVFITVAGEPVEVVEETVIAAKSMKYPNLDVYVLNDGLVAKKDNWKDIEKLAKKMGVHCITRQIPGGAKAGNINNAIKETKGEFVLILDADHVPHQDFLNKTVGYLKDPKVAFVQTPQYYKNYNDNFITAAAWEQQELFFGPIMMGKNATSSAFMCGTNTLIRRKALVEAGGMNEKSIAEDFLTSLYIHKDGWKSIYVPDILAEGLAPYDIDSYASQQFRWARGSLEAVFWHNPFLKRGLTFSQKFSYLSSASYYLTGLIVVLNAILPLIYLFTGEVPLDISTMALAVIFLPYFMFSIYVLYLSSGFTYSFRALAFSLSCFPIFIKAIFATLFRVKNIFAVTSKKAEESRGNIRLIKYHLLYVALAAIGIYIAVGREGLTASLGANIAWVIVNIAIFSPFIYACLPGLERVNSPAATKDIS